jgi:hypothetical protein
MRSARRVIAACALAAGTAGCLLGDSGACPPFTSIVGVGFGREGDALWWTLEVEEIPAEMTFNQPDVPADFLEYRWAVDIDSDRNGSIDLRAAIEHSPLTGADPVTVPGADILSQTQERLRVVMGGVSTVAAPITASLTGATFRFETTTAGAAGLGTVTESGQSTWTTSYRWGAHPEDQCDEAFR